MSGGSAPWLVLDTSTPIAVVGVWCEGEVLSEHRLTEARRHAEGLIDAIDRSLLAAGTGLDEMGGVGVGRGPGSFIGVRTGIATAKGICLGRGIPLVGLPTLVALARSVPEGLPDGRGLAVVDAKRGEVFAQLLQVSAGEVIPLEPPLPLSPAEAARAASGLAFVVVSQGGDQGPALFQGAGQVLLVPSPSVSGLGLTLRSRLAMDRFVDELASLVPDYCRAPDAKLPAVLRAAME